MYCYWPRTNVPARVKKMELPDKKSWKSYKVRIFTYAGKCMSLFETHGVCGILLFPFMHLYVGFTCGHQSRSQTNDLVLLCKYFHVH